MAREITELEEVRRDKLEVYKRMGIDPFARGGAHSDTALSLNKKYHKLSKEVLASKAPKASVAGRMMAHRGPFIVLKAGDGRLQVYVPTKELPLAQKALITTLDIGDIIHVAGVVMKTDTGALVVRAKEIKLLSKSLRALPEKFHGLKDTEERYRRRYVDLIMNDEVRETFLARNKIITTIRHYMEEHGYFEAETPILQSILGGAAAKPFTTYHNALNMPFYLRVATELHLKRLLVGGFERVYEIGRIFRNEGIDTTHNPEFTSIEFYEAYTDLEGIMQRTEEIFGAVAQAFGKKQLVYDGKKIMLKTPFARINMVDAVSRKTRRNFREITLEEAKTVAVKHGVRLENYDTVGHIIAKLFEELIEGTLVQPTFVTHFPIEISPLAARSLTDGRFTDRAELYINGREYANMFTELTDPIDQLERFESQLAERKAGNEDANEIDLDFVEALEYGMPPAGGCGIGIDRLVMLFTNQHSIREVLLFPHLRAKGGPQNDK